MPSRRVKCGASASFPDVCVVDLQRRCWALWVDTGPFEPSSLYQFIVRLRPSAVMSQHSRVWINALVSGKMSRIVSTQDRSAEVCILKKLTCWL